MNLYFRFNKHVPFKHRKPVNPLKLKTQNSNLSQMAQLCQNPKTFQTA